MTSPFIELIRTYDGKEVSLPPDDSPQIAAVTLGNTNEVVPINRHLARMLPFMVGETYLERKRLKWK